MPRARTSPGPQTASLGARYSLRICARYLSPPDRPFAGPGLQIHGPVRFIVGAGKPTPIESYTGQISCGSWLASDSGGKVRRVDRVNAIAGKPAPTGGRRHSDLLQELASPAPKSHAPLRFTVGAGKPTPKESCTGQISCGSWLASDSGGKVRWVDRVDAIAGKPAPTGGRCHSDLL